jgi:hypothetical protein
LSSTAVASPGPFYFNAQGEFQRGVGSDVKNRFVFRDVTNDNSSTWFFSGDLTQIQNGIYNAPSPNGCACLDMIAGGLSSQSVQITIGNPAPACTPCPAGS